MPAKECCTCRQWKSKREFYNHQASLDGLQSSCKECAKEQLRAWRRRQGLVQKGRDRAADPPGWGDRLDEMGERAACGQSLFAGRRPPDPRGRRGVLRGRVSVEL